MPWFYACEYARILQTKRRGIHMTKNAQPKTAIKHERRQSIARAQPQMAEHNDHSYELRGATSADASALAAMLARLSKQTRYLRFGIERPLQGEAARREVERMLQARALIGVAPRSGEVVAIAELAGVVRGSAELAVVVRDDYQAQGVGTTLVEHTLGVARSSGITTLRCYILPENRVMLRLVQKLDVPRLSRFYQGLMEVTLRLAE